MSILYIPIRNQSFYKNKEELNNDILFELLLI